METKQFQITGVRKIMNIDKPIIVFDVAGKERGIARAPKQAIMDLQNSLLLSTDVDNVNDTRFDNALRKCIGGTLNGNIRFFKAGDEYTIEAGHPALTDKNHDLYGKVKEGDKSKASTDGAWVDGFLSLQYNQATSMQTEIAREVANSFASMFGGGGFAPQAQPQLEVVAQDEGIDEELAEEVVGKKKTAKTK